MKKTLMEILACPHCRTDLILREETAEEDEIVTGRLECSRCHACFDIRHGVPCMLQGSESADRTRQGFSEQWRLGQAGKLERARYYGQHAHSRGRFLSEIDIVPKSPNAWMLDTGCGSCDLTYAVGAQNPQTRIVGLDFCDTIYRSAEQAPDYPNVDFVHGDIMLPPFKRRSFTSLYAWGSLHHTNNTRTAFKTMTPLVARGGSMAAWIYPHRSESPFIVKSLYSLRDLFFLGRGHLIPVWLRFRLAQATSLLASPAFGVAICLDGLSMATKLGRQRLGELMRSFEIMDWRVSDYHQSMTFLIFDTITPEYQFRHRQAEVLSWFKEDGFSEAKTHDAIPGYYWARRTDGRHVDAASSQGSAMFGGAGSARIAPVERTPIQAKLLAPQV